MFFKDFWLAEISTSPFLKATSLIKKWGKKKETKNSLRSFEEKSRNIRRAARKFFLSNYSIASQEARNEQQIPIQRDRSLQR